MASPRLKLKVTEKFSATTMEKANQAKNYIEKKILQNERR